METCHIGIYVCMPRRRGGPGGGGGGGIRLSHMRARHSAPRGKRGGER